MGNQIQKEYREHFLKRGFELKEKIGSGLSGSTIKGFQKSLNRDVAIKLFDNKLNKNNVNLKKRFMRESKILAKLQHPSIPYVITDGLVNDIPYIIMQYISNITLEDYIKKHAPISLDKVLKISSQILTTLDFVHKKDIIHRDIKPSNIMLLTPSLHCYLIDFSIGFQNIEEKGLTRVTQYGEGLGTDIYMSPEQRNNMRDVDARTDIYSYALIICELLTNTPILTDFEKIKVDYPKELNEILGKALKANPNERYQKAKEFLTDLNKLTSTSYSIQEPSDAFCLNYKCPNASFTEGFQYYSYPNFIYSATTKHCEACGERLTYRCNNCSSPIKNVEFCGGCGKKVFKIPKCKTCQSWLKIEDMDEDTAENGCSKCKRKAQEEKERLESIKLQELRNSITVPNIIFDFDDDEIPF